MSTVRVSDIDHRNLITLLELLPERQRRVLEGLDEEIASAEILPVDHMPADVVTMGSMVAYEDTNGRLKWVQLSYPEDADMAQGRVSIFAPVGAALIGLRVGQEIIWPLPNGRNGKLKVKQVIQNGAGKANEHDVLATPAS